MMHIDRETRCIAIEPVLVRSDSVQNVDVVVDGKHSPFALSVSFDRIPLDESQRHWSHLFSCVSE